MTQLNFFLAFCNVLHVWACLGHPYFIESIDSLILNLCEWENQDKQMIRCSVVDRCGKQNTIYSTITLIACAKQLEANRS